jgi:hypothetical protein
LENLAILYLESIIIIMLIYLDNDNDKYR